MGRLIDAPPKIDKKDKKDGVLLTSRSGSVASCEIPEHVLAVGDVTVGHVVRYIQHAGASDDQHRSVAVPVQLGAHRAQQRQGEHVDARWTRSALRAFTGRRATAAVHSRARRTNLTAR